MAYLAYSLHDTSCMMDSLTYSGGAQLTRMAYQKILVSALVFVALVSFTHAGFGKWPGTKWCGLGTDAASYDDLASGSYLETDKCCRAHDHCPHLIPPFKNKYGAFNWNLFTMYVYVPIL
ncbi:hypothetical protein EB796_010674 [Bugula neritina]|uniref:Phospholipase A2-like central domain-containing protein n=1 Tax=Bugula neritina TaxID=10212 RepID=A0A7J7JX66_BUGNE|nr:hypothetical protein EB796_010674 [Bugula neritina]